MFNKAFMPLRAAILLISLAPISMAFADSNWLAFRGDGGRGDASQSSPPTDFDVQAGKNVAWKTATTGRGIGGPLVVDKFVVVTGCDGEDNRDIHVEAFDRESGKRIWLRSLRSTGRPYTHPTSSNASPSPISDGSRVFALYSSCDLVCFDLQGKLQWLRGFAIDHPKTGNDISMSSSPALIDGVLCVQLENQGDSFAEGIEATTGKTLWSLDRPRDSNWSTPQAITLGDGTSAFVLQDASAVTIVNAKSGEVMHKFDVKGDTTSSCSYSHPMVIVPGGETTALQINETGVEVAWQTNRLSPRRVSPVIYGERIYMGKGSVLIGGNLSDGEVAWQERLPGINEVWASPLYTAAGIFVFDAAGNVVVVKDNGEDAEVIAEPKIGEAILATPAAVGDSLYLRTDYAVVRLTESP